MSELKREHHHTEKVSRRGGKHLAGDRRAAGTAAEPLIPEWAEEPADRSTASRHGLRDAVRTWQDTEGEVSPVVTGCRTLAEKAKVIRRHWRRLVREKKAGHDLGPTIDKMNALIQDYNDKSKPAYCAKMGFVDEIVKMPALRNYVLAFTEAAYQNPKAICPFHQMLLPRIIRDQK